VARLLWGYAFLGWREFDLGRSLWFERWYNPWLYLGNPTIPWTGQLFLSLVAVGFLGSLAWVAKRHRADVRPWYGTRSWVASHLVGASGVLCFVASASFDKYRTIKKHFGIDLAFRERVYAEEALELFGAALLFAAALEFARAESRASADAGVSAS
jgi:hypothetical protein